MSRFDFTVNGSFLSWPSHPITVPKRQVEHAREEPPPPEGATV